MDWQKALDRRMGVTGNLETQTNPQKYNTQGRQEWHNLKELSVHLAFERHLQRVQRERKREREIEREVMQRGQGTYIACKLREITYGSLCFCNEATSAY